VQAASIFFLTDRNSLNSDISHQDIGTIKKRRKKATNTNGCTIESLSVTMLGIDTITKREMQKNVVDEIAVRKKTTARTTLSNSSWPPVLKLNSCTVCQSM